MKEAVTDRGTRVALLELRLRQERRARGLLELRARELQQEVKLVRDLLRRAERRAVGVEPLPQRSV